MSGSATIKKPDDPVLSKFTEAYAELVLISVALKPSGDIPDVDAIKPLVLLANKLAAFCESRIEAGRNLVKQEVPQAGVLTASTSPWTSYQRAERPRTCKDACALCFN